MKSRPMIWLLCTMLAASVGCHRQLVGTPYVLQRQDPSHIYANCPRDCQKPDAEILYATDRALDERKPGQKVYGHDRSSNLAYGVANVSMGKNPKWQQLIEDSTTSKRSRPYELTMASVQEAGHLPWRMNEPLLRLTSMMKNPDAPDNCPGGKNWAYVQNIGVNLAEAEKQEKDHGSFQRLLRSRLAESSRKDVYIFIHGFNNTFDDAVFRTAELWHFLGRVGVPVTYSWPAGWGGIRGYAYDRESGEYTVSHLRRFIKAVADCPDVERVHLIAHSRGCEVTTAALRELHLICSAQNKSTRRELKLENLVLAAPDLDEAIFMQRYVGEGLLMVPNRTTIYASQHDRAIELSDVIFASRRRLGTIAVKDFSPKIKLALSRLSNVQFIECKLSGLWIGHSYVFDHPAAMSDMILVLRDCRPPGREHGRPLRNPAEGVWELTEDYLRDEPINPPRAK